MLNSNLIIRLYTNKIFLPDKVIPISNTNLPQNINFLDDVYWEIIIREYNEKLKEITVSIKFYTKKRFTFTQQIPLNIEIDRIKFLEVKKSWLDMSIVKNRRKLDSSVWSKKFEKNQWNVNNDLDRIPESYFLNETKIVQKEFPFKKLKFNNGSVAGELFLEEYSRKIHFEISNEFIKEEFSTIYNYLIKWFKTKKIDLIIKLELRKYRTGKIQNISVIECKSKIISQIDSQLIDKIKIDNTIEILFKMQKEEKTKNRILSIEELWQNENIKNLNIENYNTTKFLEYILSHKKYLHHHNISYLSKKHGRSVFHLRFIPRPFSFLFLLIGEKNYHFVLESLDFKLATYIWHIPKSIFKLKEEYHKLKILIQSFDHSNRNNYIRLKIKNFDRVIHDYRDKESGFMKWKENLDKLIF